VLLVWCAHCAVCSNEKQSLFSSPPTVVCYRRLLRIIAMFSFCDDSFFYSMENATILFKNK
jgi:hypothetical protein